MNAPTTALRLLVVDDEPDLRTLYELTLLRDGYHVDTATCVEDARHTLSDHRFDAVITDMRLPDGSGLDVLRHVEALGRGEKTIVITAYGSAENAVEALKAGAFDYLTKPVDLKQFRQAVASALASSGPASAPLKDVAALKRLPQGVASSLLNTHGTPHSPNPPDNAPTPAPADTATPDAPLAPPPEPPTALARLTGNSSAIQQVRTLIDKVARSMAPVLLWGESGTGKELVARAIHDVSARRSQPFIAVNCGAIPEHLLEAEFFGYRKGAFTGAQEDREGFFQAAQGGTLFLDEIGDLPLAMQSKLLRAIQERAVRPVGAVAEHGVDVRILSASHKDLAHEVGAGRFRQDLFYRLNVILISLPPLRQRLDDLPLICADILRRLAQDWGRPLPHTLSPAAWQALQQHPFPGNVRELENMLQRAVALCTSDAIEPHDLGLDLGALMPPQLASSPQPPQQQPQPAETLASHAKTTSPAAPTLPAGSAADNSHSAPLPSDLVHHLDDIERDILIKALEQHHLNRTAAGASLGLSLRQMRYRMARLGVQVSAQGVEIGEQTEPPPDADPDTPA